MHDVEPHLYSSVIREMIRHENDVTNHRLMWLLIVQGLIANAYVNVAAKESANVVSIFPPVGILVTLSAFIMLYKSYQARGYLEFIGNQAKRGALREQDVPLLGWPRKRLKGWRAEVWLCPWLGRVNELLEPYFFLPGLLVVSWLFLMMRSWIDLRPVLVLLLATVAGIVILALLCIAWVWGQTREETAFETNSCDLNVQSR